MVAALLSSAKNGRMSAAPSAQLMPTVMGRACATEVQNASMVWPDRVRPLRSVMVAEIITGRRMLRFVNTSSIATMPALVMRVSVMVSKRRRSTPPSMSPSIWVT